MPRRSRRLITGLHAYDHIDPPPIRPPPDKLAPGSPFGPGLCALVLHLHVTQAIGLQRLACLLAEVFWPAIGEGALARYRADLDRPEIWRLSRLFATPPATGAGRRPARAITRCSNDLFVFLTRRDVPATNNACQRALRPSVIFHKITGCFRSQ